MKKILIVIVCLVCFWGCHKFNAKTCDYCGGQIFWSQTESNAFSESYAQEYESKHGVYYHKWCFQIVQDLENIKTGKDQ